MIEGAAAFVAWLGASLIVLSDGRRGLSAGLAVAAAGMAGVALEAAGAIPAAALLGGGLLAGALRWRTGPEGWRIMPAGSTGRLILCVACAIFGLWIAVAVMTGAGSGLRFAALVAVVMMGVRVLSGGGAAVVLTAAATIALAISFSPSTTSASSGPVTYFAGAVVALLITLIPVREPDAA